MKKKLLWIILALGIILLPQSCSALNEVNIYFFHSNECNYCEQEKAYLEALKQRYFNVRVYSYEVSGDTNYQLMLKAKELYNVTASGVPFTVVGDTPILGFSQNKKCDIEKQVYENSYHAYSNKLGNQFLNIGYQTNLVGDIPKYNDNSNYEVEDPMVGEDDNNAEDSKKYTSFSWDKYKFSIILGGMGLGLGAVVIVLSIIERKRRI